MMNLEDVATTEGRRIIVASEIARDVDLLTREKQGGRVTWKSDMASCPGSSYVGALVMEGFK